MVILWASVGFCTTYVDNLTTIPHHVFQYTQNGRGLQGEISLSRQGFHDGFSSIFLRAETE